MLLVLVHLDHLRGGGLNGLGGRGGVKGGVV